MRKGLVVSVLCALACCATAPAARGDAPKNVILFIGDGMGFEHVKAGGMYANGAAGTLSFEAFPHRAEMTTHSADNPITDSAASATAIATGHKVNNGVVGMAYPANDTYVEGEEMLTLLEHFRDEGKSTGMITMVYMPHGTPAGFGAHEPSRDNKPRIADDYLTQTRPSVLLGGARHMEGAAAAGYTVVTTRAEMLALNTDDETMVSGQFGDALPYEYDGDFTALPHIWEMTQTALDILDNDPDGFFLMIEGGTIDWAAHDHLVGPLVGEVVGLARAVQTATDWAQGRSDTLILVTADHETGGLTVLQNNGQGKPPDVSWSSDEHTAANVPIYAWGANAELVSGVMDNTDLFGVATAAGAGRGLSAWGVIAVTVAVLVLGTSMAANRKRKGKSAIAAPLERGRNDAF